MKKPFLFPVSIGLLLLGFPAPQAKSASLPATPQPPLTQVTTTYDATTNKTTVQTSGLVIVGQTRTIRCQARYSFSGKSSQFPEAVTFSMSMSDLKPHIWSASDGYIYFGYNHLSLGQLWSYGEIRGHGIDEMPETETLTCDIPTGLFLRMFGTLPETVPVSVGVRGENKPEGVIHSDLHENYLLTGSTFAAFHALAASIPPPPKGYHQFQIRF